MRLGRRGSARGRSCPASHIELWTSGAIYQTLSIRPAGDPPTAVTLAEGLPVDTAFVAVVWDLQCCSYSGPCSPTDELLANGARLSRVVDLGVGDGRHGLAFRVTRSGTIVQ